MAGCGVGAGVDEPGLAGEDDDGEEVVDVVGHRDDVGLDRLGAVGVEGPPDRVEESSDAAAAAAPRSSTAGAGERTPRRHLAREQRDARRTVEVGVGRVELADAVVEVGERGVVLVAVLADVEGGQAQTDRRRVRMSRRMAPSAVSSSPPARIESRIEHEVGEQLVEAGVVAAGLVRRCRG